VHQQGKCFKRIKRKITTLTISKGNDLISRNQRSCSLDTPGRAHAVKIRAVNVLENSLVSENFYHKFCFKKIYT